MSDWDKPDNFTNTIGFLTLYQADYDGELSDFVHRFDWDDMSTEISRLREYLAEMEDRDPYFTEEYDLIGMNSNSFHENRHTHHLFLEWDKEHTIPEPHVLEQFDGMIIETDGGFHLIKEAKLSTSELFNQMKRWNCCPGFTSYSESRFHACLRVCPKEDNFLRIRRNKEGFLYSVYRDLVEGLKDSW